MKRRNNHPPKHPLLSVTPGTNAQPDASPPVEPATPAAPTPVRRRVSVHEYSFHLVPPRANTRLVPPDELAAMIDRAREIVAVARVEVDRAQRVASDACRERDAVGIRYGAAAAMLEALERLTEVEPLEPDPVDVGDDANGGDPPS